MNENPKNPHPGWIMEGEAVTPEELLLQIRRIDFADNLGGDDAILALLRMGTTAQAALAEFERVLEDHHSPDGACECPGERCLLLVSPIAAGAGLLRRLRALEKVAEAALDRWKGNP